MTRRGSKNTRAKRRLIGFAVIFLALAVAIGWFLSTRNFDVFEAQGTIADQERGLLLFASLLSLIIVVPVFALTFFIAWKYRASNKKARYAPEFDRHRGIESLWWGVPLALIIVLSVVTWISSHQLDPYKPLVSDKKPLEIQVVALDWKWLFIYPEENIATVNFVQFPEDRPVNFTLTSDAPMNSFWIPQLGGQIYTMNGMSTKLHLEADRPGTYRGSSANISGRGFAGMVFTAKSTPQWEFEAWLREVQRSGDPINMDRYQQLAQPSENNEVAYYTPVQEGLYDDIVMQYMGHHASGPTGSHTTNTHEGH